MKKRIAWIVCLVVLAALLAGCANASPQEGPVIDWIDPGFESDMVKFEVGGENLYRVEAMAEDQEYRYGFIDGTGKVVIPVIYNRAGEFSEGLCFVELGDRKIYIDPSGKEVLDMSEYITAGQFEHGLATVRRQVNTESDGTITHSFLMGLIDKSGNEVIPCEYADVGVYQNGVLWAERDNRYLIFNGSGERVTETEYDYIWDAGEVDMLIVAQGGRVGYLDIDGNVAIPLEYDGAYPFFDGAAMVMNYGEVSFINTNGEKLTSEIFETGYDFYEGLCVVARGGRYGYINTSGELQIPLQYDEAFNFRNGVAVVVNRIEGKPHYSTIDKNGDIAIVPEEQGVYKWNDAYIAYYSPSTLGEVDVDLDNMALLDSSGKRLTGFYYADIGDFKDGFAVATFYPGFGARHELLNKHGAIVAPYEFEKIEILNSRNCLVQLTDYTAGENNSRVGILRLSAGAANQKPE